MKTHRANRLRSLTSEIFTACDAPPEDAEVIARHLVGGQPQGARFSRSPPDSAVRRQHPQKRDRSRRRDRNGQGNRCDRPSRPELELRPGRGPHRYRDGGCQGRKPGPRIGRPVPNSARRLPEPLHRGGRPGRDGGACGLQRRFPERSLGGALGGPRGAHRNQPDIAGGRRRTGGRYCSTRPRAPSPKARCA